MPLNGLQFACDECDCHARSRGWKLGSPEYYQIVRYANTLVQLLIHPSFFPTRSLLVEHFRIFHPEYRRDEAIKVRSQNFPCTLSPRRTLCAARAIHQAEATWGTCAKSPYHMMRWQNKIATLLKTRPSVLRGWFGKKHIQEGLRRRDLRISGEFQLIPASSIGHADTSQLRIFTPSTFGSPQRRVGNPARGGRGRRGRNGFHTYTIHRTNQTIGTLYHFASPAALRMDGERELRVKKRAKGEW